MKWFRGIGLLPLLLLLSPVGPGPAMGREKEAAEIDAPKTPVRVQLNGRHRFRYAGFYAAESKGYYRAAGLKVELAAGVPGQDYAAEVISGRAQYGVSGVDLLPRRLRGEPVRALAAIFQHSPEVLIVRAERGINRPRDLIGRRVMSRPDNDVAVEAMLRRAGIAPSEIRRVPHTGDFAGDFDALIGERVDAISGDKTYGPYHMERRGVLTATLQPSSREIDFYGDILFTSEAEWTENPARVRAFRQATLRGWVYAMNHPEEVIKLIRFRYGHELTVPYLRFEWLVMRQLILPDVVEMGHMSVTRWRHIAEVYRELDMIPEDVAFDPAEFLFDPDVPPERAWAPWVLGAAAAGALLAGIWALAMTIFNSRLNAQVLARTEELDKEVQERRQIAEELRRTQERHALVIQGSNDGIWDWDLAADTVYFSPRWKEMLGYADGELPNRIEEWRDRVHPEDWPAVLDAHERYWDRRSDSFKVVYRLRAQDGEYRWILGRATCIRDESGRPLRMIGSHSDVTERKKAEAELAALRRLLRNIIDALPSAIVAVDPAGRVTHWSAVAADLAGLPAEAAAGRPFDEVLPQLAGRRDAIRSAIRDRRPYRQGRLPVPGPDEIHYFEITVSPLSRVEDAGAVIRLDDIGGRVRMEEIMIQSEKMLSVGGLAAGMAHEINNPLGAVIANADLVWSRLTAELPANRKAAEAAGLSWEALSRYLAERKIGERMAGIQEAGRRAGEIVENMLQFSRKSGSRRSALSLAELAERTIDLARNHAGMKKALAAGRLEIVRAFDPDVPPVPGAATEIQQVLFNLLANAFHSLENCDPPRAPGRIELRIRRKRDWAEIEVADNGPGMREAVRRRVFEPFFTTKGPGEGTGLGLSVSYFIVAENHGGQMTVDSLPGRGTTFRVRLPLTGPVRAGGGASAENQAEAV
jgi:PAS domain S-box-containing protein